MATRYWSPTADGDFTNAANWLDSAGAPSGGAPANSDTLIFADGSVSVTINISGSLTGLTIRVLASYTGNIGTLGTALTQTSFADIQCAGSGAYYKFSGTVTKCDVIAWTNSEFHIAGGTWGNSAEILRTGGPGKVVMDGSAVFAASAVIANAGARWEVAAGTATNTPTCYNDAGSMVWDRNFGTIHNGPNSILIAREAAVPSSGNVIHNYGVYYHWTTGTSAVVYAHRRSSLLVKGTPAPTPTVATLYRFAESRVEEYQGGARLTIGTDVPIGDVAQRTAA